MNKFMSDILRIVRKIFGVDPVTTEDEAANNTLYARAYQQADAINFTAIFACKLSTLAVTESSVEIEGGNQRAELIGEAVAGVWARIRKVVSIMLGTGGVCLIPYEAEGRLYTDIVPQNRLVINRMNGDEIRACTILAEMITRDRKQYFRWVDYDLDSSGNLTVKQRATRETGQPVSLWSVPEWMDIDEEVVITGVEHLPFAYMKSPADNRQSDDMYGCPITYGCDQLIGEIMDTLRDVKREYDLKKPLVGMDATLFEVKNGYRHLPRTGLFMPVMGGGLNQTGKLWDVFDPAIRDSAYYNRLDKLYELFEKQVGTSSGILTKTDATRTATATEIKAAKFDTYALVVLIRDAIIAGIDRLCYAFDLLANINGLGPAGEYAPTYDWNYSMIESSQETFTQLMSAISVNAADASELRQFLFPDETADEAKERVAENAKAKTDLSDQLLREALRNETQNDLNGEDEEA